MAKITGIGNALTDVLVRLTDDAILAELGLPKGGMKLIDDARMHDITRLMHSLQPTRATGGSASNTMLALAHLGAQPVFIGCVADDEYGRFFRNNCAETGIEARLLTAEGHSGVANTFISPDGERTFATYLGAAASLSADHITDDLFRETSLLHIEGYLSCNHALTDAICHTAQRLGVTMSLDLASYNLVESERAYLSQLVEQYIDIVFANEEESAAFTGCTDPEAAAEAIAQRCKVAVVKVGSRGALAVRGTEHVSVPAHKVEVVDTTAAGDFFAGGFLYAYTRGATLEQCLQAGTLLGGQVIQTVGTRLPDATWDFINQQIQHL
ncbi:MAG: adenosine kinase [Bacteroidaceae bacterium]|nr:adenosine kinase [Bacteroidaceae bacterium]